MGVRSEARAQPASPGGGARRTGRSVVDGERGAWERASRPFALYVTCGLLALAALAALALFVVHTAPRRARMCDGRHRGWSGGVGSPAGRGRPAARPAPPGTGVARQDRDRDRRLACARGAGDPGLAAACTSRRGSLLVIAVGALAGAVAAYSVPLKAPGAARRVTAPRTMPRTPKQVTVPLALRERDPFAGRYWLTAALLLGIVAVAAVVRLWHFNSVGYNSDEAVYAGQGAGIAHDSQLAPYFPVFRAHPLLFQSVIAIGYELHQGDWFARAAAIAFGALCVVATFELGRLLYGVRVGLIAASVLALMPYHVIVSRQVLLDVPRRSSRRSPSAP